MVVVSEAFSGGRVRVLTPTGDLLTAEVVEEIRNCIESAAPDCAIVDLGAVRLLVSGSLYPHAEPLTPLVKLHQQLLAESKRLVLCNLHSTVAEVFRVTRLDQLFEVQPDRATAVSQTETNDV